MHFRTNELALNVGYKFILNLIIQYIKFRLTFRSLYNEVLTFRTVLCYQTVKP